jgi:hypothetical protein
MRNPGEWIDVVPQPLFQPPANIAAYHAGPTPQSNGEETSEAAMSFVLVSNSSRAFLDSAP